MKLKTRIGAMAMSLVMALSFIPAVFAANATTAAIDTSRDTSLTLYKYDLTAAQDAGAWDATSYVSSGLVNEEVNSALSPYAVQGVEFSYLKVADLSILKEDAEGAHTVKPLYGFTENTKTGSRETVEFLSALGLTTNDAYTVKHDVRENRVWYFESDTLINALSNALSENATSTKAALESYKRGIVGERDTALALNASDYKGIDRNQTQNAVFVNLCQGHPTQTELSRCITADYGKAGMSNRKGEMSGVLYVKEATKRGCKEAYPGDTVDLGYAGSNTRRGRVGHDIAHTLETSCAQGVVERGGKIRRLMPRECLRLQGFAEDQIDRLLAITSDAQAYKQAGNSVTVNVIEAIGRNLRAVDEELKAGAVS